MYILFINLKIRFDKNNLEKINLLCFTKELIKTLGFYLIKDFTITKYYNHSMNTIDII